MSEVDSTIAAAFVEACRDELDALKPGNVHRFAAGHGMTADDFLRSAEAAAPHVAGVGLSVGARVLRAVEATREAVGQNTNLGILLLCAPLAAAAESGAGGLQAAVSRVLGRLDILDAVDVFAAIALANPGGLGRAAEHDVREAPTVSLLEAMSAAADRDRVARQYAANFEDVFGIGLKSLDAARSPRRHPRWSTLAAYLAFLAEFPDTHVVRKFDLATAEALRGEAAVWRAKLAAAADPKTLVPDLIGWDAALKARGVNPGTSADLTVAALFAAKLRINRRSVLPSAINSA